MNKRETKKLTSLGRSMRMYEDSYQEAFSPRDFGMMSFRAGVQDGDFHTIEETATRFRISESRVQQIQKMFVDFKPKKGSRSIAAGKIENNKLTAEHETEGKVEKNLPVRSPLQMVNRKTNKPQSGKEMQSGFIVDLNQDLSTTDELPDKHHIDVMTVNINPTVYRQTLGRLYASTDKTAIYRKVDSMILAAGKKASRAYLWAVWLFAAALAVNVSSLIWVTDSSKLGAMAVLSIIITLIAMFNICKGLSLGGERSGLVAARRAQIF